MRRLANLVHEARTETTRDDALTGGDLTTLDACCRRTAMEKLGRLERLFVLWLAPRAFPEKADVCKQYHVMWNAQLTRPIRAGR